MVGLKCQNWGRAKGAWEGKTLLARGGFCFCFAQCVSYVLSSFSGTDWRASAIVLEVLYT